LSNKQQQQERKPSAEAQAIRDRGLKAVEDAMHALGQASGPIDVAKKLGGGLMLCLSFLVEIAAQLAEINSRDTAAEIRAREAEAFVLGMQQELQKLQGSGLVIPGLTFKQGKQGG